MKYMGSKAKIAKEILPIILQNRTKNQYFVDLFCGGCNLIDKVDGLRIANDNNKYLIALWCGLRDGLQYPTVISKDLYDIARTEYNNSTNIQMNDFEIGWIGFMASFNGRFFSGGYSGIVGKRNYIDEQIRNTLKQTWNLRNVYFTCSNYDSLELPSNSIIYCDIPYKNTKQYDTKNKFDYDKFWQWCRDKTNAGFEIYISEYEAPSDFQCVWSKDVKVSLNQKNTLNKIEKLFIYNSYQ